MRVLRSGFQVGEVSPLLEGRGDLPSLSNACRQLRNAIPRSIGGVFQRPGFILKGHCHTADHATRLLPFTFAASTSYLIELGNLYARFWKGNALCITQPLEAPETTHPGPETGTASLERWVAMWGTTIADMVAWANAHAATTVTAGSGAPQGTGGTFTDSIQRVRAWFVPPASGNVKFRMVGSDDVSQMKFESAAFGTGTGAVVILSVGVGNQTQAGTQAVEAGKSYWCEFMIGDWNPPSGGTFQFSMDGGAWVTVGAGHLSGTREGAVTEDEIPAGASVATAVGEILRLNTPWTEEQVKLIQSVQANDVVWLTQGDHWPQRLIRYGLEDWRMADMPVLFPPLRDPNVNNLITLSASAISGAEVTLTATGKVFDPLDIGGYYEISHRRDLPFGEVSLSATGNSPDVRVVGRWEVFSYGKWTGVLKLYQRRKGTGAVDILRTWKSTEDTNVQANGEIDGDQVLYLHYEGTGTGSSPPRATVSALDAVVRGLVKITSVASPTSAKGKVIRNLHSTDATIHWSEGAWSQRRGFPQTVCIHEQRLWFANTKSEPQKVWASAVSEFDNFERTSLDDSAMTYQIASQQSNPIISLIAQEGLLMLTTGDEWVMDSGDGGSAITPAKIRVKRRSGTGSERVQPVLVGSVVLFVQIGGLILAEYAWDYQQNNFEAVDLSELAEHLGSERITQIAFAQNPHGVLWMVTDAGSLLSVTYKRRSGVVAWAKHTTPYGRFESVCCRMGANGTHEVEVTVQRRIGELKFRTVEGIDPDHWRRLGDAPAGEVWAGDAPRPEEALLCIADGARVVSAVDPFSEVTGLDHLEGATVGILLDGAIEPAQRVVGGKVTLPRPATKAVVGLVPEMILYPMPLEIQLQTGASLGRTFRASDIDVKFWKSGAAEYADGPEREFFPVDFRTADDVTGERVPLKTVQRKLPIAGNFNDSTHVILRNRSMLPLNVLALVMQVNVHGE